MSALVYYLYNQIPGVWQKWTLAVLAVSQADADNYVELNHKGGKRAGKVDRPGMKVTADCGAVTERAGLVLKGQVEDAVYALV